MSIWNKVLLSLIFLATLGFFHAAIRTLKTYKHWADKVEAFDKKLSDAQKDIVSLQTADHSHPREDQTIGVRQLHIDLGRVLANRGRIWAKCEKQKAQTSTAGIVEVSVATDESVPNTFTDKMMLYVFEEGDDQSPGKYLGEFQVKAVSEKHLVLASTTQLPPSLLKNLGDSKGPWVLYEMIPTDEHEALANLPEEQKKWVSDEYLKDGQADASGKTFVRPLRDYLAIFRACETHRTLFADRWESTRRDLGYLEAASQEAKNQEAMAEKEKTQVSTEKQRALKELKAVSEHLAALQRMFGFNKEAVSAAIVLNRQLAQGIAKMQKDAADLIDRRTRSMAQYGPGAN
jgi:hypothetical protein